MNVVAPRSPPSPAAGDGADRARYPSDDELRAKSDELESKTAEERLAWAVETFGEKLLFTSSFGAGSAVLLDMWARIAGKLPIVFLDTGFLFEETIAYRDTLIEKLDLNVKVVRPKVETKRFLELYGTDIQKKNPDFCCAENKVAPIQGEIPGKLGWVSGLRRDQGRTREGVRIIQPTDVGPAKIHPIADWTSRDAYYYMKERNLPEHPLFEKGYVSIGCAPCTRPISADEDERAGRWSGSDKTECGLHTFLKTK